jgi:hypothetical protein
MTEITTRDERASATDDVVFPAGRYGRHRERRRTRPAVTAVLTLAVVAAGVGVSWSLHEQYGHGDYAANLLAFDDSVPGQVEITFEVYKPADEGAVCRVRSRDLNGAEIAAAEVLIPADESTRVVKTYTLAVTGDPNTGEVQRCWQAD